MIKVSTYVQYPLKLDLQLFLTRNISSQYDLTGFIQHIGGINGGHYIAYCKNYKNNNWYELDDIKTRQVTEKEVLEKEAYILFYQKKTLQKREKFKNIDESSFIPSYWRNLYYTQADPGPIYQNYLVCSHGNIKPCFSIAQFSRISAKQDGELRSLYKSDGQTIYKIEQCKKCLIDFAGLNMRVEAELDLINELNSISPFEGPWYLISCSWLDHWKKYCSHENIKGNSLPPPIDNSVFLESGNIRKSLQAGKDYRGVNRHVWNAFVYLYKGGPEIKRLEVDIYSEPAPKIDCSSPALSSDHISKLKELLRHHSNS